MDSVTLVRRRIGDSPKTEVETFTLSDGTNSIQLQYENPTIVTIFDLSYKETALEQDTDYTQNGSIINLLYEPTDETLLDVSYRHTAFSDEDITELVSTYGVNGAVAEALRWLLADSARLYSYSRGATNEQLDQVFAHLEKMLKDAEQRGDLNNPSNTGTSSGMTIAKRTTQWYRNTVDLPTDISRDDYL